MLEIKLNFHVYLKEIALVKNQLKDNADRLKREKTVIVGDVKPMIDSLFETEEENKKQVQFKLVDVKEKKQQVIINEAAKRKAEREKSEIAKSIPKESIRTKIKFEFS
jgi:anion-transporting  ArsA/GET3 family ATPase